MTHVFSQALGVRMPAASPHEQISRTNIEVPAQTPLPF
jgi:hypothetical protein